MIKIECRLHPAYCMDNDSCYQCFMTGYGPVTAMRGKYNSRPECKRDNATERHRAPHDLQRVAPGGAK